MAATKTVTAISKSKNTWQEVDGLLSGRAWQGTEISYSFPTSAADYESNYGSGEPSKGFGAFNTTYEQDAFRQVFANIAAVTPLTFVEHDNLALAARDATIRLGKSNLNNAEAWAYYPSTAPEGGDAWFDNSPGTSLSFTAMDPGSYTYTVLMHELGHSVGLKHSFENGSFGTVPRDSLEYTVMSYSSFEGAGNWYAEEGNYPQTLMQYDVAALQRMYGADFGTNAGDTTYRWDPGNGALTTTNAAGVVLSTFDAPGTDRIFMTVWDGGGLGDTFDFSNYTGHTTGLSVDLQPGGWTIVSDAQRADLDGADRDGNGRDDLADGSIAVALETRGPTGEVIVQYIENVIGAGSNDTITGNRIGNRITGGDGADILLGAGARSNYRDSVTDVFDYDSISDSDNVAGQYDTIRYFEVGYDDIDLRGLGITENELSFVAGSGGTGTLYGNVDGIDAAELRIDFVNLTGAFVISRDVLYDVAV